MGKAIGRFIRSIIGLDKKALEEALKFLQTEILEQIKLHLLIQPSHI